MTGPSLSDISDDRLPEGEAHVRVVRLALVPDAWPEWESVLSSAEKARAQRFVRAEDRFRFAVTRAVLRRLVGGFQGLSPAAVWFTANHHGKPGVPPSPDGRRLQFNVSHSGEYALLGFCRRGLIGVDVERINDRTNINELAPTVCTPTEQKHLAALPQKDRRREFYRCWTLKEAHLKAIGVGLNWSPQNVETVLTGSPEQQLGVRGRWKTRTFDLNPDGFAAVVASGTANIVIREWPEETGTGSKRMAPETNLFSKPIRRST